MGPRPRLKQQFRPLRRGDGRVQLGLDPSPVSYTHLTLPTILLV